MKHPWLKVPRPRRLALFGLFLVLTLAAMLALNISGRPLITSEAPAGIVSYEFAGNVAGAVRIIDSWDETARVSAGFNLGLDYLYLFLYANAIAMALLWLTEGSPARWLTTAAAALAWGQWLAAFLDATENFALFTMLVTAPADPWPGLAWWCAAAKFALIITGLVVVLVAAVSEGIRRARH
jgi:hypothetical protein